MIVRSFEFIDAKDWCRLVSGEELLADQRTYAPLFGDASTTLVGPRLRFENETERDLFFNVSTYGFKNCELVDTTVKISGSILANLGSAVVKDSSLLLLVRDGIALTEGYGDSRWLKFQLETWPDQHDFPVARIAIGPQRTIEGRIKMYCIKSDLRLLATPAIYLTVRPNDRNVFHWFFEVLPRLKALDLTPKLRELPLIMRESPTTLQLETLRILGVENTLVITHGASFRASHLYFPSIPAPASLHAEAVTWLRNKFLARLSPLVAPPNRRLYISRNDAARKIINESELMAALTPYGFERLVMSDLPLMEQINAFRAAEVVVLPHGAAGTFMLFAPEKCKLIELMTPHHVSWCYFHLSRLLGQGYSFLFGESRAQDLDYRVDVDKVLEKIGAPSF